MADDAENNLTDGEVLDVVAQSIREALRTYGVHVAFQQVRTAPESLIVHFSAFQLQAGLQRRWPGQFRVLLEEGRRHDLQLDFLSRAEPPFVFEFKIPWSGDLIASKIVDDMVKVWRCTQGERGCVVTVFLLLGETPTWANQRTRRYTATDLEPAVRQCLARKAPDLVAQSISDDEPVRLQTDEAQIDCTVTLWYPRSRTTPPGV